MAVLPMFPLGTVLLPGSVLPLHVFEPRYRALVQDCLAADVPEFGVALIDQGSEVGGGDVRSQVGCVARIVQLGEADDGRYALITVGMRRIRINAWLPDDPYPLADVDEWPEGLTDGASNEWCELLDRVHARVRRALALSVELGDTTADPQAELADDPVLVSHQLAALAPLGPTDRQALLGATSPMSRVEHIDALLDDVDAVLQMRLGSDHPGGA